MDTESENLYFNILVRRSGNYYYQIIIQGDYEFEFKFYPTINIYEIHYKINYFKEDKINSLLLETLYFTKLQHDSYKMQYVNHFSLVLNREKCMKLLEELDNLVKEEINREITSINRSHQIGD